MARVLSRLRVRVDGRDPQLLDLARWTRVTANGITYRASTLAGVYVMLRKDPSTPGTDDGWVYGTLKPNGELTSSGRVASCMACHTAKPGRFLGQRAP